MVSDTIVLVILVRFPVMEIEKGAWPFGRMTINTFQAVKINLDTTTPTNTNTAALTQTTHVSYSLVDSEVFHSEAVRF